MSVNNGFKVGPIAERLSAGITGLLHFVTDAGQRRWTRANGSEWEDLVPDAEYIGALTEDAADLLYAPIAHASLTNNPHAVTAAQVGALTQTESDGRYLQLTGGTLAGSMTVNAGRIIQSGTTSGGGPGVTLSRTNNDPVNGASQLALQSSFTGTLPAVLYGTLMLPAINSSSNAITSLYGQFIRQDIGASYSGTIANGYTLRVAGFSVSGGAITTAHGLYIDAITQGGTNYAIYTNAGQVRLGGELRVVGNVGFYNTAPIAKPTVAGSKAGNAALASLITALASLGLITDSTT